MVDITVRRIVVLVVALVVIPALVGVTVAVVSLYFSGRLHFLDVLVLLIATLIVLFALDAFTWWLTNE